MSLLKPGEGLPAIQRGTGKEGGAATQCAEAAPFMKSN
jgi:hypothetical protein